MAVSASVQTGQRVWVQATCKEASVHDEKGVTRTELSTAAEPKLKCMSIRKSNLKAS